MREHDQDAGQTARNLDRLTGAILDGRYRIDEKLAAGGFGAIYRATDLVMGREVALKVLHRELVRDAQVVERFRREANALAKLRDPHTITMYDVGETPDGTRYIVMELLRGQSLHELFHSSTGKRIPWRRVVSIARGVCSSLREAHSVGIVHRDLKPANIHLERNALEADYVKVLDFGIAKMVDTVEPNRELTLAGQMIGTFDYMPPEQMIGGMCTGKSDVFTLAVVIYEMICGERPFGEATGPASRLMTLLGTTPTPLAERVPGVPPELDRILMSSIERDPELRPDIFGLDNVLARVLDDPMQFGDEAKFGDDDGPTWIEPVQPQRITPLRVSNPTRAPSNRRVPVADTLLGSAATTTPSRGIPIVPRSPATPSQPAIFALGTRKEIPPAAPSSAPGALGTRKEMPPAAPASGPRVMPVYVPQPVNVRFHNPPAQPVRTAAGTGSPMQTGQGPATTSWKRQAGKAFMFGVVVAMLLVAMIWTLYLVA